MVVLSKFRIGRLLSLFEFSLSFPVFLLVDFGVVLVELGALLLLFFCVKFVCVVEGIGEIG